MTGAHLLLLLLQPLDWVSQPFREDQFSEIMERIQTKKKQPQQHQPEKWTNRQTAKNMTDSEFETFYREQEVSPPKIASTPSQTDNSSGFIAIGDLLKR